MFFIKNFKNEGIKGNSFKPRQVAKYTEEVGHNMIVIKLSLQDKRVISLPVSDMLYFGEWHNQFFYLS